MSVSWWYLAASGCYTWTHSVYCQEALPQLCDCTTSVLTFRSSGAHRCGRQASGPSPAFKTLEIFHNDALWRKQRTNEAKLNPLLPSWGGKPEFVQPWPQSWICTSGLEILYDTMTILQAQHKNKPCTDATKELLWRSHCFQELFLLITVKYIRDSFQEVAHRTKRAGTQVAEPDTQIPHSRNVIHARRHTQQRTLLSVS